MNNNNEEIIVRRSLEQIKAGLRRIEKGRDILYDYETQNKKLFYSKALDELIYAVVHIENAIDCLNKKKEVHNEEKI